MNNDQLVYELIPRSLLFSLQCPDWFTFVSNEMQHDYFQKIIYGLNQVVQEGGTFYPPLGDVFKMFNLTPYDKVKVVIIGQDPYSGEGKANGLAFSVNKSDPIPPSLANMFKSITRDEGGEIKFAHGDLTPWAQQGVLLLNTHLTVPKNDPLGHRTLGWKNFTKAVISNLAHQRPNVVFLLMGQSAQELGDSLQDHVVVKCAHPSPHSAPKFFESTPFLDVNAKLMANGLSPIDWVSGFTA